jgi:LmbE family N-acetylglucosaminyl deacetylase
VPYRLLGLVADPDHSSQLCGHTFPRYAAAGALITLVCAAASERPAALSNASAAALGIHDLVLLDYQPGELAAGELTAIFADLMAGFRPHVVVAPEADAVVREAATAAFHRARGLHGGSAALPAKLYYRPAHPSNTVSLTTSVGATGTATPEFFIRMHPSPWVTGVLERDLFAGVPQERDAIGDERLAG